MKLTFVRRSNPSALFSALSPLIAFGATLIVGGILFAAMGKDPLAALYSYFVEPLTEVWSLHELAIKATPLIIIGIGLAVCFRSNNWNIGAEGQFVFGAVVGSILPVLFPHYTGPWLIWVMALMGVLGGMFWAFIPAFLKNQFGTNEILSSLMLVYVAQLFLDWLVRGPWRNPEGFNFPESRAFSSDAILPEILSSSGRAHMGFIYALILAFVMWYVLSRTMKGFQISLVGQSARATQFGGFSVKRTTLLAFLISGAFAGYAGIVEVSGAIGQLRPVISPGYGFTAIIVAFLGRLNPLGIVAAGLVLALSYLGGEAAQISLGISDKAARVFQGMLLFFVLASDTLIHYSPRFERSKKQVA